MRPPKRPRPLAPSPAQAVQDRQQEASRQHREVSYMEDQVEAGSGAMVEAETYSEEYGDYGDEYETGQGYGASAAENKEYVRNLIWERIEKLGQGNYQCKVC